LLLEEGRFNFSINQGSIMETVAVYNYKKFDIVKGEYVNPGTYATKAFIESNRLEIVEEIMLEVPLSSIDGNGQYIAPQENR
jgi:hypothetical protein